MATQPMLVVVLLSSSRAHAALWESNSATHDDYVLETMAVGRNGGSVRKLAGKLSYLSCSSRVIGYLGHFEWDFFSDTNSVFWTKVLLPRV
jgi:hypothetical protein